MAMKMLATFWKTQKVCVFMRTAYIMGQFRKRKNSG